MKRMKKYLSLLVIIAICLGLCACGEDNGSSADKSENTADTAAEDAKEDSPEEDSQASEADNDSGYSGFWKYKNHPAYIIVKDDMAWEFFTLYRETKHSGKGEMDGETLILHIEGQEEPFGTLTPAADGMVDDSGNELIRTETLVSFPQAQDDLTETAPFSGNFENITVNYPKNMHYKYQERVPDSVTFQPDLAAGSPDFYSNILLSFMPIDPEYDKYLGKGNSVSKRCMEILLNSCFDKMFGKFLIKSLGTNFEDKGNYYKITGYMWLDGSLFNVKSDQPVRGCMEVRYFGPTGYVLVASTVAYDSRIQNYYDICSKMLETVTYKTDWTTAPKTVPKSPGKAKAKAKKTSGNSVIDYYWTDEDGDIWYWNGYENIFMAFGSNGYIDDDGQYYENNDAGWTTDPNDYYDDYDPWSDPGDTWGTESYEDWSDPGDYSDYGDTEDYSDYSDAGDYEDYSDYSDAGDYGDSGDYGLDYGDDW